MGYNSAFKHLTFHKSATLDRRLYFTSEGRHVDVSFALKIRRHWPGLNRRSWVPEGSMLNARSPTPLWKAFSIVFQQGQFDDVWTQCKYGSRTDGIYFVCQELQSW
jgi:hypothetical protein